MRVLTDIIKSSTDYIKSLSIPIDVMEGSVIKDVVVDVPAKEFQRLYALLDLYQRMQTLDGFININTSYKKIIGEILNIGEIGVTTICSIGLDNLIGNFGVIRKSALEATGNVRFYFGDNLKKTITTDVIVATADVEPIVFTVVSNRIDVIPIIEAITNRCYIDCEVKCTQKGRIGNVPTGAIQRVVGISATVINLNLSSDFTNGRDKETDEALIIRAKNLFIGRDKGTRFGYINLANSIDYIDSANTIDYRDSEFKRGLGNCDLCFAGIKVSPEVKNTYIYGQVPELVLSYQPVLSISSVKSDNEIINPSNYLLIKDVGEFSGSIKGRDKIVFIDSDDLAGTFIEVSYIYNSLVYDLQNIVDNDNNRILGVDVLVRQGIERKLDFDLQIIYFNNNDNVLTNVEIVSTLEGYLGVKELGEGCDLSDLVAIILGIENVDRLILVNSNIKYSESTVNLLTTTDVDLVTLGRIGVLNKEYLRLGKVVINGVLI